MPQLRLALAQVNPCVGDLAANAAMVRRWTAHAAAQGAQLVAFPEMVLTGYPVEDLALRPSFVDASRAAVQELARDLARDGLGDLPVVVGFLDRAPEGVPRWGRPPGSPQNCAAVLHRGEVVARYAKHHLPNYGVFDEYRIFVPGDELVVVDVGGTEVALAICEDLWADGGPVAGTRAAGADLLLVINGSPYERDKDDVRLELVRRRAAQADCALAYVNLVGGQDELVFDGDSLVVSAAGEVLARAPQFADGVAVLDLNLPDRTPPDRTPPDRTPADGPTTAGSHAVHGTQVVRRIRLDTVPPRPTTTLTPGVAPRLDDDAEVYSALVTGLRDYVLKNGFRTVTLGLSGGIDSALVAVLACDAIGPDNVVAYSLPSVYSSDHSRDDAADLAARTGLDYRVQPIAPMVASFVDELALAGLAEENVQARVRGVILMAASNAAGHLVLATSNKTELAVGYSTIYGDSVGGFAPLKDVPKTAVWRLSRWRNAEAVRQGHTPPIPQSSIDKPPSAELRPDQRDDDTLPDYEVLDAICERYVAGDAGREQLLQQGFEAAVVDQVVSLVDRAEWKRRQFAPGPKISLKAFGRDRRLPVTSRWREHDPAPSPEVADARQ